MHQHPGQEVEWVEGLGHSQAPVSLASVENLARGFVDPHSVEACWRVKQVAAKTLDLVVILRSHRNIVVRREPPGVERYDSSHAASRFVPPRALPRLSERR